MEQTPPLETTPLTLTQHIHQLLVDSDKPLTADDLFTLLQSAQAPLKPDEKKAKAEIGKIMKEDTTQFFPYPKKAYWHKAPLTPAEQAVEDLQEAVAKLGAEEAVADAKLGKPKAKAGPEAIAAFEQSLKEMLDKNELYFVNGKYTKKRPLSAAELIEADVLKKVAGSDKLFAFEKLAPAKKNADASAHNAELRKVVDQLLSDDKLFEHAGGKYASFAPKKVEWYEKPAYKKAFEKTLKATRELLQLGNVTQEEFIASLQFKLQEGPTEKPKTEPVSQPAAAPAPATPTAAPEKPVTTPDLPTIIKAAYDHLRKFPEFRDGMVDLPSLFHETKNRFDSLTEKQYHDAIWQLNTQKKIQLHELNEVHKAQEKHLAISKDDRLFYYLFWNA